MLQRIDSRGSHLATSTVPSGIAVPTELAAGSIVRVPFGAIAADFEPVEARSKRGHATYELVVCNDTSRPLATFAYAVEGSGMRDQITWNAIVVPPFSAIAIDIDVAIPKSRRMPRVVAELFTDEAQLTLDAPPFPQAPGVPRRIALAAAAALALALGGGAFAQAHARVVALGAPDSVRAGVPFSVAYAFSHATTGHYVVETPDGLQVRRGALGEGSGAFTVALPPATISSGYDVRVSANGRFGDDERTTHVLATPSTPVPAATPVVKLPTRAPLGPLVLAHDTVHAGESIVVDYHPSDDPGLVRLIDSVGTVRAEAMLNKRGESIVVAPLVDADQDFRIVATAERGNGHEEASAPVTILRAVAPMAPPSAPGAVGAMAATGVVAPRTLAAVAVDRAQVVGRPVVVRIDRYERDLHIALMGSSAGELTGVDVAPGEASITLVPPALLGGAKYEIVATYTSGLGQETLIRPIAFRAP